MKKLLSLLLAFSVFFSAWIISAKADEQNLLTLYVSVNGSDTNDGTAASPLKTVEGAKARLRELKGTADGAKVYFEEGVYSFDRTLLFTEDDMANVTFIGTGDVRFSGAFPISGFEEETVNGVRAFTKQLSGPADFKSLFNGDKPLTQPRFPEKGYFTVKATDPANDLWTESSAPWSLTLGQRSFFGDPADLAGGFTEPENVTVRILHYWHDEMMTLTELDTGTGRIGLSRPSTMLIRDIDRYYFENVFEALNEPGEWYLSKTENKLYYIPEAGETPETTVLEASAAECLIDINGVDGIGFEGIRFEKTDWNVTSTKDSAWWGDWRTANNIDSPQAAFDVKGVVSVRYAENISFTNCEFIDLGATAVKFMNGVKNSSVENCYFENIAATGIFVGGANCLPEQADYTENITVRNNEIYRYGRKFFCAIGIQITFCDTAFVENNEIHDGYYTGISDGWNWGYTYQATKNISIKNNLIYNIGQGWLSDMGGIYTLGIQPGTVLSGNVIHNIAADPGEGGYGGWGIYLDEGSSQILVENNLVFACGSDGYHLHYGADNTVRNNIFALNSNSQIRAVSKDEEHKTADFYSNILLTDEKAPLMSHARKNGDYTAEDNIFWNLSSPDSLFVIENDDLKKAMSLETAQRKGFIGGNTVTDPCFVDAAAFDFRFAPDAPTESIGFEPWDYTEAGTVKGSVIGIGRAGGETEYNAETTAQSYSSAKERFGFFMRVINRFCAFFHSLLGLFGVSC